MLSANCVLRSSWPRGQAIDMRKYNEAPPRIQVFLRMIRRGCRVSELLGSSVCGSSLTPNPSPVRGRGNVQSFSLARETPPGSGRWPAGPDEGTPLPRDEVDESGGDEDGEDGHPPGNVDDAGDRRDDQAEWGDQRFGDCGEDALGVGALEWVEQREDATEHDQDHQD